MNGSGAGGALLMLGLLFLLLYFAPTIIAGIRHHRQALAIAAVNFFFGWTAIGWIVSLVWALTSPSSGSPTIVVNASATTAATPPPPAPQFAPREPSSPLRSAAVALPPPRAPTAASLDDDTRFWDGLDKNDPDLLEEYLIRFPAGRFVPLARRKLERQGLDPVGTRSPVQPPHTSIQTAPPLLSTGCGRCGASPEPDSTFCTACGANLVAA